MLNQARLRQPMWPEVQQQSEQQGAPVHRREVREERLDGVPERVEAGAERGARGSGESGGRAHLPKLTSPDPRRCEVEALRLLRHVQIPPPGRPSVRERLSRAEGRRPRPGGREDLRLGRAPRRPQHGQAQGGQEADGQHVGPGARDRRRLGDQRLEGDRGLGAGAPGRGRRARCSYAALACRALRRPPCAPPRAPRRRAAGRPRPTPASPGCARPRSPRTPPRARCRGRRASAR